VHDFGVKYWDFVLVTIVSYLILWDKCCVLYLVIVELMLGSLVSMQGNVIWWDGV
jgi:hypothetical protein